MNVTRTIASTLVVSLMAGLVPVPARAADGPTSTPASPAAAVETVSALPAPAATVSPRIDFRASIDRAVARALDDPTDQSDQPSVLTPKARTMSKVRRDDDAAGGGGGGGGGGASGMIMMAVGLLVSVGTMYYYLKVMKKNQDDSGTTSRQ